MSGPRVAVVASGFPRLSETFALHELDALDRRGVLAARVRHQARRRARRPSPAAARCASASRCCPPATADEQAAAVADRLDGSRVDGVHGYFAHAPGRRRRARGASRSACRTASAPTPSTPARCPPAELGRGAPRAPPSWSPATPTSPRSVARGRRPGPTLVRHGVDLDRFRPRRRRPPTGRCALLAVGPAGARRRASTSCCAALAPAATLPCRLRHRRRRAPSGDRLERRVADLRPGATGSSSSAARTHAELPADYAAADVVVVPSRGRRHAATATGCPTSCSRRWPAGGRWSPATSPRSPPRSSRRRDRPARPARRPDRAGAALRPRSPPTRRCAGGSAGPAGRRRRARVRPRRVHRRFCRRAGRGVCLRRRRARRLRPQGLPAPAPSCSSPARSGGWSSSACRSRLFVLKPADEDERHAVVDRIAAAPSLPAADDVAVRRTGRCRGWRANLGPFLPALRRVARRHPLRRWRAPRAPRRRQSVPGPQGRRPRKIYLKELLQAVDARRPARRGRRRTPPARPLRPRHDDGDLAGGADHRAAVLVHRPRQGHLPRVAQPGRAAAPQAAGRARSSSPAPARTASTCRRSRPRRPCTSSTTG